VRCLRAALSSIGWEREFAADVVHELRTPIAGMRAVAEAALKLPIDSDADDRQLMRSLLTGEAQRAARLMADLLKALVMDAGEMRLNQEPCDIRAIAVEQVERVRLLHPGLTVLVTGVVLGNIDADPDRVAQILGNLLDNACSVTSDGGRIVVSLTRLG
jgi:two-component system OmpR family sensor kinase